MSGAGDLARTLRHAAVGLRMGCSTHFAPPATGQAGAFVVTLGVDTVRKYSAKHALAGKGKW